MLLKAWRRYRIYALVLLIPYLFMVLMMTVRAQFTVTTPGGLSNVENSIRFEREYPIESAYFSIYIMSFSRPTLFQVFLMQFDQENDLRVIPREMPIVDTRVDFQAGSLRSDNAWNQAVIALYEHLNIGITYREKLQIVRYYNNVIQRSDSGARLAIRDTVLSVNGNPDSLSEMMDAPCNQEALFVVEKEATGALEEIYVLKQETAFGCLFLIEVDTYYEIIDKALDFGVAFSLIGGPSGGLIQFLYMYDVLTERPLAEGLIISGTGGLNARGEATAVGGIRQKVITAERNQVDVFFVPQLSDSANDNYQIAIRTKEELGLDLTIVGIQHWQDAVHYLEELRRGE